MNLGRPWRPHRASGALEWFCAAKTSPQGEFISPEDAKCGAPAKSQILWGVATGKISGLF